MLHICTTVTTDAMKVFSNLLFMNYHLVSSATSTERKVCEIVYFYLFSGKHADVTMTQFSSLYLFLSFLLFLSHHPIATLSIKETLAHLGSVS